MPALLALTVFLGAALLFVVQPLAARQILPLMGGSPAVWNTAMLFFQAALLAGYAASHAAARARRAILVCLPLAMLALALASLPPTLPRWDPGATSPPLWVLGALAVSVGLPFLALSMTSPVAQAWLARTDLPGSSNPYYLYAASNAGSFVGLLGYPFLIEPALGLAEQRRAWAWALGLFAALMALCAAGLWRRMSAAPLLPERTGSAGAISWRRRARWVLLAMVPSSLMLGVTGHITTDIAAVPLLWVLPLAIYLLTFVAAFAGRAPAGLASVSRLFPVVVVALALAALLQARQPVAVLLALHLIGLAMGAYLCHGRLAADRPEPARLTEFFLLVAIGGALGGLVNAILAPALLNGVYEYPAAIVLAAMLRLPGEPRPRRWFSLPGKAHGPGMARALDLAVPAVLIPGALVLGTALTRQTGYAADFIRAGVPTLLCFLLAPRPVRFAVGAAVLFAAASVMPDLHRDVLLQRRTFFGVLRVSATPTGDAIELRHGTTLHGVQLTDPALRMRPTTYYHPTGPIGDVFSLLGHTPLFDRVGVIGLGAGSLAAYGRPGQTIDFYEIDPAVVWIARDWGRFTFLSDSRADSIRCIVGDGRVRLASAPDGSYGLLIIDAFSSDAIPVHLITRQAIDLYMRKIRPDGLLALHISNRHLDLAALVHALADDAGLALRINDDGEDFMPEAQRLALDLAERRTYSAWAVLARTEAALGPLADRPGWSRPVGPPSVRPWTDDYSNIFAIFDWRGDLRVP